MRPLEGKVALITGAARGQGRSRALRLAQDGAQIVAVDIAWLVSDQARYVTGVALPIDAGGSARA